MSTMDQQDALAALQVLVTERTRGMGWWATPTITQCVVEWLRRLGAASAQVEAPVVYSWRGRPIAGRVDVLGTWPKGGRLAVEVDRTNKPQSLVKLRALRDDGCRVLWLRWNEGNHHADALPLDVPSAWLSIADPQRLEEYLSRAERRRKARARKHSA
jgi:hypothetical protein